MALEDLVKNKMMESAKNTIDLAYSKLSPDENKQKFPLQLFNDYFAPYFFGQKPLPNDSDIFAAWVGIAGSPMASVDVMNNDGKVEFTVPPLYNTDVISFLKQNDISSMMNEYQLHSNSLPSVAMKFVENKLLPEADNTINKEKNHPYIEQWGNIASLYNKNIAPNSVNNKVDNGNIANNDDNDLSYDV